MKKFFLISGLFLFSLVNVSTSYVDIPQWGRYKPVFMKRTDLDNSVSYRQGARPLTNPGKIYSKPPYIFVNERYKGIHVINNANPAHPVNEGFIIAPGCIDMAVKDHTLYLDNSVDLVAFDLNTQTVTRRLKNVFPEPAGPDNSIYYGPREGDLILVEWKKSE